MSSQEIQKIFDGIPNPGMDFEYCTVRQTVSKTFVMSNPLNQLVRMDIKIDDSEKSCFKIEPKNCKLHSLTFK